MVGKFIEGILPGIREFRAPFASGILWTVAALLWFGDQIVESVEGDKAFSTLGKIAESMGRPMVAIVGGVIIYSVGMATARLSLGLSSVCGSFIHWIKWPARCRATKRELVTLLEARPEQSANAIDHRALDLQERVTKLDAESLWLWPKRDKALVAMVEGDGNQESLRTQAAKAMYTLHFLAYEEAGGGLAQYRPAYDEAFVEANSLVESLPYYGKDDLRVADERSYLAIDRESAEIELRVVSMPAMVAISSYAAVAWSGWFFVPVALCLYTFFDASVSKNDLTGRILNIILAPGSTHASAEKLRATGRGAGRIEVAEATAAGWLDDGIEAGKIRDESHAST